MKQRLLSLLLALAAAAAAPGQDVISPAHHYSWGENIGWMNWLDAGDPPGSQGVRVHATFLSGLIWGENAGWISVGDGSPANGVQYANVDGDDSGVNIEPSGDLHGYAWGENIGWVQFDTRSLGAQRARLDRAAQRFRGYAWGENVGWINLDDAEHYVGIAPEGAELFKRGDANADAAVDISDPLHTIGCLFLGTPCTECRDAGDSNDDGDYDIADPVHTLNWLFRGGPEPPAPGPFLCGQDATSEDRFTDCLYDACL
jgi:hypothetical protein